MDYEAEESEEEGRLEEVSLAVVGSNAGMGLRLVAATSVSVSQQEDGGVKPSARELVERLMMAMEDVKVGSRTHSVVSAWVDPL